MSKNRRTLFYGAAGLLLTLASFFPETPLGSVCGVLFAFQLCWLAAIEKRLALNGMYLAGVVFHLLSFYWLGDTLVLFGGFPQVVGQLLAVLFALVSAIQFVFVGILFNRILQRVEFAEKIVLSATTLAVCWTVTEFLFPRLFPWALGHTVASFTFVSSLAELGGVSLVTLTTFLFAVSTLGILNWITTNKIERVFIFLPFILTGVGAGLDLRTSAEIKLAPKVRVGVVQGNLGVHEKGNTRMLTANLVRYQQLSQEAVLKGAEFLIWPETVSSVWLDEERKDITGTKFDPFPAAPLPLMYGGLGFSLRSQEQFDELLKSSQADYVREHPEQFRALTYNAVFFRTPEGSITERYYKQVLMPFGEYLPFAEQFPQLYELSPQTGNFAFGDRKKLFHLSLPEGEVRAQPLICYEDLVPRLSREGVERGANLLINFTNDAWYGDTAAPHQHHLLAQMRAVESRRAFVRSTNTGLTAVVDPRGRTVEKLPVFSEGVGVYDVPLMELRTVYSVVGELVGWLLVGATGVMLVFITQKKPLSLS